MREILFRGKTESGEWVTGTLDNIDEPYRIGARNGSVKFETVITDTVGQYTGLEDKNGEKIFEDDIVCWPKEDGYGHVYWAKDEARFVIEFEGCIVDFDNLWGYEIEVYGNIHDNPELLGR